jgi:hypothetical protein
MMGNAVAHCINGLTAMQGKNANDEPNKPVQFLGGHTLTSREQFAT